MNWEREIEAYRVALLRQLGLLLAGIGLVRGGSVARLSKVLYLSALWVLRPIESAARRLVVGRAEGMTVSPRPARPAPNKPIPKGSGKTLPSFPLLDALKPEGSGVRHPSGPGPRLTMIGDERYPEPEPSTPSAEDGVDAARLCARIEVVFRVLEDLQRHARRLARWRARAEQARRETPMKPGRRSPLRPGWPPGYRQRHRHPVDEILLECQTLARMATKPPI